MQLFDWYTRDELVDASNKIKLSIVIADHSRLFNMKYSQNCVLILACEGKAYIDFLLSLEVSK